MTRVLLVEDNPGDVLLLREYLNDIPSGQELPEIETVDRLSAALHRLTRRDVDAVLLDLSLPDSQGLETLDTLLDRAPEVPVVVLTGSDDQRGGMQAVQAGAQDYIRKDLITGPALARVLRYAIERHRIQAQLRESNNRLRAALDQLKATQAQVVQQERLRALGQMASGIAHDLNNCLAPILGFCDLLLADGASFPAESENTRFLRLIQTGAQDAVSVIRRLREFYRPETGLVGASPAALDLLAREAMDLTEPRWRAQAQAQGLAITITSNLAGLPQVVCDPPAIRQLFTNLILNAADALPQGGRILLRGWESDQAAIIEVVDNGIGMDEETRRNCFEPFFTTKSVAAGSGLGLAIAGAIVHRHGGTIEVDSAPTIGTTFRVRLPLQPLVRSEQVPAAPRPIQTLKVLLVDDNEGARNFVSECLRLDGHEVVVASEGEEALRRFRAGTFDLVVTDLAMPGISGLTVATEVKRLAPAIRVLMLSGFGDLLEAKPEAVDVLLTKPVDRETLRRGVAQAFSGGPASPEDARETWSPQSAY